MANSATKLSHSPAPSSTTFNEQDESINNGSTSSVQQTLDRIHTRASRSDTLTTFDLESPPRPPTAGDIKGIAGDIYQTGFSGLYSRLKASVGASSSLQSTGHDSGDDASIKSFKQKPPPKLPPPNIVSSVSAAASASSSRLQSPQVATFTDSLPPLHSHHSSIADPPHFSPSHPPSVTNRSSPTQSNVTVDSRRTSMQAHLGMTALPPSTEEDVDVDDNSLISPKNNTGLAINNSSIRHSNRLISEVQKPLISSVVSPGRKTAKDNPEPAPNFTFPADPQTERPTLVHVSQSHLPGFKVSRESSIDDEVNSSHSGQKASVRGGMPKLDEELRRPNITNAESHNSAKLQRKVIDKKFWMRDETAKECFYCGEPFSTFRRKHHCRICGNIFDSKCTNLVPGRLFGQSERLRICKPCEASVYGNDDDSSVLSEDDNRLSTSMEYQKELTYDPSDFASFRTPTLGIPVSRKGADKRGSSIIEFANEHNLSRPSSSRSLKSRTGITQGLGHKRNSSKTFHQHFKSHRDDDRAPFQKDPESSGLNPQIAVQKDTVFDPELAPFLSDDNTSEDDSMSIFATLDGEPQSPGKDNDRLGLENITGSRRKTWLPSDKGTSVASRDADNISLLGRGLSKHRRRNLSTSSFQNSTRPSPKRTKSNSLLKGLAHPYVGSPPNRSSPFSPIVTDFKSKMIRSSAMRGADAPAVELNQASLLHVKNLLKQMLHDANIEHPKRWEKSLTPILLQCTDDVNPDVEQSNDDMDIRQYVKLKKIPGSKPGDTAYVSGVVFTKNLALKSMPRSIANPRILIVAFPIEYARQYATFMSLDPVMQQEREYLNNLVKQIAALSPHVLLSEHTVSRLALELLDSAGISVVQNVKPSVLNAVARCTETFIVASRDQLSLNPKHLGTCASFDVKTYRMDDSNSRKSFIYLTGCRKDLGCTIVLRGSDWTNLRKLKRITEFMCYVVYNLKLETCIMRDECVSIPTNTSGGTLAASKDSTIESSSSFSNPSSNTNSQHLSKPESENSQAGGEASIQSTPFSRQTTLAISAGGSSTTRVSSDGYSYGETMSSSVAPSFYSNLVEEYKTKIISASPFVKFMQPYLLSEARQQESKLIELKKLRDQYLYDSSQEKEGLEDTKHYFALVQPEMVHQPVKKPTKQIRDFLFAVHDAEFESAKHAYLTQKRQWEAYMQHNPSLFDPFNHQKIAVLYSMVNSKANPCEGPATVALEYYVQHNISGDFLPDIALGEYVRKLCESGDSTCDSPDCNDTMFQHHRQYVHGDGRLTISLQPYPSRIRGVYQTILMWSVCRICNKETQVTPMSDNTEKYSFGKYLELTFWSPGLYPRAQDCPHDIHRDHIRFLQYNNVAVRVQYDSIQLYEIGVPKTSMSWNVDKDLRLKNESYRRFKQKLDNFIKSVRNRIDSIKEDGILEEKREECKVELQRLRKLASEDHERLTKNLQDQYMNSRWYEIIALNKAARTMHENSIEWDEKFEDFERNFFPSEKDIKRITALQIRRIFERATSPDDTTEEDPQKIDEKAESPAIDDLPESSTTSRRISVMSPEDTNNVLASAVKEHESQSSDKAPSSTEHAISDSSDKLPPQSPSAKEAQEREDVKHLDLAVTSDSKPTSPGMEESRYAESMISPKTIDPKMLKLSAEINQSVEEMRAKSNIDVKSSADINIPGESKIPRPKEALRRPVLAIAPSLNRAHSQPHGLLLKSIPLGVGTETSAFPSVFPSAFPPAAAAAMEKPSKSERFKSLFAEQANALKTRIGSRSFSKSSQSMIPRSIPGKRNSVFSLAKHYEQLSREFQKQRIEERKLRESRAYPLASSKPVVEVYRNEHEAAQETESLEDIPESDKADSKSSSRRSSQQQAPEDVGEKPEGQVKEDTDTQSMTSHRSTIDEADTINSDDEHENEMEGDDFLPTVDEEQASQIEELAKQEKSSLLKILTNFWGERSSSGWSQLDYPFNDSEHFWEDSDVIVREDEPSSIIALALSSPDYLAKMRSFRAEPENPAYEDSDASIRRNLGHAKNTNIRYAFQNRGVKVQCKIFYAESFDAVRRKTRVAERFVESLSRCKKWNSKGGKTKSLFLKTLDDRFILKSLSSVEVNAFFNFAPDYFAFVEAILYSGLPSVIAKMFGLFQVTIRSPSGLEFNWFMLCMENLFYDRVIPQGRMFDLKGSMRNRKIQSTGERDEVLLDENFVDIIFEKPIFVREHTVKLLRTSVYNDTKFLSKQNVMDYSLMAGFVDEMSEIVVGIIDCIRTYTLDKKLETWFKDRGSQKPTITSPKDYKNRFRVAMGKYILLAPNCWHQFQAQHMQRRPMRLRGKGEDDDEEVDGRELVMNVAI